MYHMYIYKPSKLYRYRVERAHHHVIQYNNILHARGHRVIDVIVIIIIVIIIILQYCNLRPAGGDRRTFSQTFAHFYLRIAIRDSFPIVSIVSTVVCGLCGQFKYH